MKTSFVKISIVAILLSIFTIDMMAQNLVTEKQCNDKGEEYIFAGGECIQFYVSEGDVESELNIVVHGTWKEGTNTLGRYAPFADNLSMATDITTVAIALPGYSDSSTNHFPALSHNGTKNLAAQKEYIEFLSQLVQKLKIQFDAEKINYIGHSAGAFMGSTLTGYTSGLIDTMTSVGAGYDIHSKVKKSKELISLIDFMDKVDRKTKYLLVYGTKDTISKPEITKNYYKALQKAGLSVKMVAAVGAVHIDLDMTDESVEAITEMLENEE